MVWGRRLLIDVHPVVARQASEAVGPTLSDRAQAPVAVAEIDLTPDERAHAGRVSGAELEIGRASGLTQDGGGVSHGVSVACADDHDDAFAALRQGRSASRHRPPRGLL